jgi:DNA-directed RNA polymerase subunit beta
MCEIPFMTPSGTFVINGAERVVVSQIIRSAGAYFTSELDKKLNQIKYMAQVIPTRGAWIEYELGSKDIMYAKLDRSKKCPMTTMMRALGFIKEKRYFRSIW